MFETNQYGAWMSEEQIYNTRKTLINRIRDVDDNESWEEFAAIYRRYIYAVVRRMNVSQEDTNDILQQVLIKLWEKLPSYSAKEGQRFRSWLNVITKNCVIDFIRSQTARVRRHEAAGKDEALTYLQTIRVPEIEEIALREWEVFITNKALENIQTHFTGKAMTVFQMKMKGVTVEDIAQQCGIKPKTVYELNARVVERLTAEVKNLKEYLG